MQREGAEALLQRLRAQTARLEAASSTSTRVLSVGDELDRLLDGGLPRGKIVELMGTRSSGRMALAVSMMAAAQAQGEWVALIDAADAFDPFSAAAAGMSLDSLLWVRPVSASFKLGLIALDRVLWAGGFGLAVLYLGGGAVSAKERRTPDEKMVQTWVRMSRQAERSKSAVLVVSDGAVTGSMSYVTLACQRVRARFTGRLFKTAETKVEVTRSKRGWPPAAAQLSLTALAR